MNANKDHIEQITDEILTLLAELATSSPKWDGKYTVLVDDNYHYMNEEYRYTLGVYDTKEEALQAAKSIVDLSYWSITSQAPPWNLCTTVMLVSERIPGALGLDLAPGPMQGSAVLKFAAAGNKKEISN